MCWIIPTMGKHKSPKSKGAGGRKRVTVKSLQLMQRINGLGITGTGPGSPRVELDDVLAELKTKWVQLAVCDCALRALHKRAAVSP